MLTCDADATLTRMTNTHPLLSQSSSLIFVDSFAESTKIVKMYKVIIYVLIYGFDRGYLL